MKFMFLFLVILTILTSAFSVEAADYNNVKNRIDRFSEMYLGYPYLVDPLGEDRGYDRDPLYRFDGFDCVTYVETVLAKSLSRNDYEFLEVMNKIRYKNGRVNFIFRNHFSSVDWIVNNKKNGLLSDVTKKLFGEKFRVSKTFINKSEWFKKIHKIKVDSPDQTSNLDYLPLSSILNNPELLHRIESGSIINIVRINWKIDISHQGFAILKDDGIIYFRHASSRHRKVIELPLLNYLKKMRNIKTLGGINVLQVKEY